MIHRAKSCVFRAETWLLLMLIAQALLMGTYAWAVYPPPAMDMEAARTALLAAEMKLVVWMTLGLFSCVSALLVYIYMQGQKTSREFVDVSLKGMGRRVEKAEKHIDEIYGRFGHYMRTSEHDRICIRKLPGGAPG